MQSTNERSPGSGSRWSVVRRRWALLLATVLGFVGLAAVYSLSRADRYEATAMVLLAPAEAQELPANMALLQPEITNEITAAQSDAVIDLVVAELGEAPDVDIRSDSDSDEVLLFTGKATDPDDAALHANTWAEAYITYKRDVAAAAFAKLTETLEQRLAELDEERALIEAPLVALQERIDASSDSSDRATLQSEYDALADELQYEVELLASQAEATSQSGGQTAQMAELSADGEARLVQMATPPTESSNTPANRFIALGIGVGLLVGMRVVTFVESLTRQSDHRSP